MFEIQLLLPQADNDGHRFTPAEDEVFTDFAIHVCGGITWLPATAHGGWLDQGAVYKDRNRIVVIALASVTDGAKIARVVEFAKQHYRQLAITIRYLGVVDII